jgi:sugar fermentation stimulation protein A
MRFSSPLLRGRLLRRYKRFLADVELAGGEAVTASCPNTGSMLGLTEPGAAVWLSRNDSPTRKYPHTWEMIETDLGRGATLVGINSGHPNRVIAEAIAAGEIDALGGYATLRREVRYGQSSRIDILLEDPSKSTCFVEIKNVHMMRVDGLAEFPDCTTARGAKHLRELTQMVRDGHRAVMVYLVQRADADRFKLAPDLDPDYGAAFAEATAAGVEAIAFRCRMSEHEISLDTPIPVVA